MTANTIARRRLGCFLMIPLGWTDIVGMPSPDLILWNEMTPH
jgi:hypothetical protein